MRDKALLFINGDAPRSFPDLNQYGLIACIDGAFHYLKKMTFPLENLNFISGDFDSHPGFNEDIYKGKVICTPNQDRTDFHKALNIILEKGFTQVDVLGGSGGEQDHFLGNLTVAYSFKNDMEIRFYDEYSEYYFIPKKITLTGIKGKIVSLYPFPTVENISTKGLKWPINNESVSMTGRLLIRNFAIDDRVFIEYEKGDLLIFIGNHYL